MKIELQMELVTNPHLNQIIENENEHTPKSESI